MSNRSLLLATSLVWGLILVQAVATAVDTFELSQESIIEATKERHGRLLQNDIDEERKLQYSDVDFAACTSDLHSADLNRDSKLNKPEFLRFISLNSARYGYRWGFAGNQMSLSELPLEFPMLFHSTACMCAYEQMPGEDLFCCEGDNGAIQVYGSRDEETGEISMSDADEAYTRLFCTEAYQSYEATFMPSKEPTPNPTATLPPTGTTAPTGKPVDVIPTEPTLSPSGAPTTLAPITPSPTTSVPVTNLPTASPVKAATTSLPTSSPNEMAVPTTPVPTTGAPNIVPAPMARPTFSPTASDTISQSPTPIITSATLSPTTSPTRNIDGAVLELGIQYGISSNCGMTAFDVMEGNYGLTIKEGLVVATETVVVNTLNATYPRDGSVPPDQEQEDNVEAIGETSRFQVRVKIPGSISAKMSGGQEQTMDQGEEAAPQEAEENNYFHGARMRVEGLPAGGGLRRNLAALSNNGPQSLHSLSQLQHQDTNQPHPSSRGLVFYTQDNPITITDVEDVLDDPSCPFSINCMKVSSNIFVTLETGDNPKEIEGVIRSGIQNSFSDASFFEAIPGDTIFCPPVPTASPSMSPVEQQTGPTRSPSWGPTITPLPGTPWPTYDFPSPLPSMEPSESTSGVIPIEVSVTYDISNDCGLDAEAVMTGEGGNTLKYGLESATEVVTIDTLNTTFPRVEGTRTRRNNVRGRQRDLVQLASSASSSKGIGSSNLHQNNRKLVYYTTDYPAIIDRIIDIETGCATGQNCLLVVTTITVLLEEGDNPVDVNKAISDGMKDSFSDGSFYGAIPEDTVICP